MAPVSSVLLHQNVAWVPGGPEASSAWVRQVYVRDSGTVSQRKDGAAVTTTAGATSVPQAVDGTALLGGDYYWGGMMRGEFAEVLDL